MGKSAALVSGDYVAIGRRYGSEDIAREGREAFARWSRDVGVLGAYGHGASALATFNGLLEAHADLRQKRPDNVALKTTAATKRNAAIAQGRAWVDKVVSVLRPLAREDGELADLLNQATPANDAKLDAGIVALSRLLERTAPTLPPEAEASARIAEVAALTAAIASTLGSAATSKTASVADTAELDLADGKLYVAIRDLNSAARKAIRNGALATPSSEYTFKHLTNSQKRVVPAKDAPTS